MDILYLLIPLSTVLALIILGVLAWAFARGQFDDLGQHGEMVFEPGEYEAPLRSERNAGRRAERHNGSTRKPD